MKKAAFTLLLTSLVFVGCSKQPSPSDKKPSVETLLNQGPVSACRVPFGREGEGTIMCRYIVTGEERPREYPVGGDSLILTTVDQGGVLTIVHGDDSQEMSVSIHFNIEHPQPGDVRIQGPKAITVGRKEQTVWKKVWESPETRKAIFSVELVVYLKPGTP